MENKQEPIIPEENNSKKGNFFIEIIKFTLISLAIVIPVRAYVAQPFLVSGPSMSPTFHSGEYIIVDQLSYHFEKPKRGEVVVFRYPKDPKTFFIKRIVGLPEETIISKNGIITVVNNDSPEGFTLDDSYISSGNKTFENFTVKLGGHEYFVLGDNRAHSSDSKIWGPVDQELIVGKPFVRLLPFSRISIFPGSHISK
jgi:signal peptidase I